MSTEAIEAEVVTADSAPEQPLPSATQAPEERVKAALARRDAIGFTTQQGIQLTSLSDALEWGRMVLDSGLAPRGFDKASHIVVAAQTGRELGLGPAASLRALYMTPQGKAALYAESALALCINSGLLVSHRHVYSGTGDDLSCTFYVLRKGDSEWRSESFSVREAKVAGLVRQGSGWEKWPKRMVLARSRAFILHDAFADVLLGCPVEGDLDDLDPDQPKPPTHSPAPPPESRQPPPGGFTLLRDAMKPKDPDAAGGSPAGGQDRSQPEASEGSAPASGGVAAAGRPTEDTVKAGASEPAAASGVMGAGVAPSPESGLQEPSPTGQAASSTPAPLHAGVAPSRGDSEPAVPSGCDHSAAVKYRQQFIGTKPLTCPDCSLLVVVTAKGPVVVEEPPPSKPRGEKDLFGK